MGSKPGLLGSVHSTKTALPGRMLVADSGIVATANSADSCVAGVAALKHLAFASRIVAGAFGTEGATAALTSMAGSSTGVRRTS
jgi:hypothetical protein